MRKSKRITVNTSTKRHMGHVMAEIRESIGLNQEEIGQRLGGKSQQTVSRLEQQEGFTESEFHEVLEALGCTREYFESWRGNAGSMVVHHIQDNGQAAYYQTNHFNPLEELKKAYEEIKQLNAEIIKGEREKNALLQETNQTLIALIQKLK